RRLANNSFNHPFAASCEICNFVALFSVHITRLATYKTFIGLDASLHLHKRAAFLHSQSDSVKHEPSGLLSNTERPRKLARANTVLSIDDHPSCREPFVESQRAILKDRSDLDGKLLPAVFAVPNPPRQNKFADIFRTTVSAMHAVRPTH